MRRRRKIKTKKIKAYYNLALPQMPLRKHWRFHDITTGWKDLLMRRCIDTVVNFGLLEGRRGTIQLY